MKNDRKRYVDCGQAAQQAAHIQLTLDADVDQSAFVCKTITQTHENHGSRFDECSGNRILASKRACKHGPVDRRGIFTDQQDHHRSQQQCQDNWQKRLDHPIHFHSDSSSPRVCAKKEKNIRAPWFKKIKTPLFCFIKLYIPQPHW